MSESNGEVSEVNTDGIRFVAADGTRFVTSASGLSTIQGKVKADTKAERANTVKQGFEALFHTINRLIEDSRTANHRRHQQIVELDAKFEDRLSAEVGSLHDALAVLNDKIDASPAGVDSVDQLREQVEHVVQQLQRLKDVVVKEMRETLSLRNLIETNSERFSETQQQLTQTQQRLADQQATLDGVTQMLEDLQQSLGKLTAQTSDQHTAAKDDVAESRQLIASLQQELAEMRSAAVQSSADAAERIASLSRENEQLKQAVARVGGRVSTLIGLGFVAVLLIIGAVAAAKYL